MNKTQSNIFKVIFLAVALGLLFSSCSTTKTCPAYAKINTNIKTI